MRFLFFGKPSPRRSKVRQSIAADRAAQRRRFAAPHIVNSLLIWLLFVVLAALILAVEFNRDVRLIPTIATTAGVVLIAGSLSLNQIVMTQDIPFILVQPLGFLLFFLAGSAEINRSPFDLLEADSEIVAGFHTEYSGMKFAMFYLVEYAEAVAMSAIISTLFLGGWRGPWLPPWLWLIVKTGAVFFLMVWVRTTMPRARIDQMMGFAWKFLLPLAVINLFITGVEILFFPVTIPWSIVVINIVISLALVPLWSKIFRAGWSKKVEV